MVIYLKKTKIRKLAQSMGYPVPALKDCIYKFYRGSEWFEFRFDSCEDWIDYVKFYVNPTYMVVTKYRWYFDGIPSKELERKLYRGKEFLELVNSISN